MQTFGVNHDLKGDEFEAQYDGFNSCDWMDITQEGFFAIEAQGFEVTILEDGSDTIWFKIEIPAVTDLKMATTPMAPRQFQEAR